MRKDITITAEERSSRGKNEARRLRVKGLTPAIVYGVNKEPVAVAVSPKEVNKILHSVTGHNTIFNIAVQGGESEPVARRMMVRSPSGTDPGTTADTGAPFGDP